MAAADARTAVTFSLSPGQDADGSWGRELMQALPVPATLVAHIVDRAYEENATRQTARDLGFTPVVPPKSNRINPWSYDEALYRRRNQIEQLFHRLKDFRRFFSRFDKLDVMFIAFIHFALITEALRPEPQLV